MSLPFLIVALITLAGAVGAVSLRQVVHCVLSLAVAFTGVAMLYLQLGAEFLGFAQFLVYIGAVTILVLFAILLTRNSGPLLSGSPFSKAWASGLLVGGTVFASLAWAIVRTPELAQRTALETQLTVKQIGVTLMTDYVLPLEVIALLLTAAMIGAVVIALHGTRFESANTTREERS